jgi:N-[(2S)-2-amino-2-carboxyethyl]-L-glutamate dehydrogenase
VGQPILQLSTGDMWRALAGLDPVDAVTDELVMGSLSHPGPGPDATVTPTAWPSAAPDAGGQGELAVLHDQRTGEGCVLPAVALRSARVAALAVLAAQRLLGRGVVTATVLSGGATAHLMTSIIAQHTPAVSHIALCLPDAGRPAPRLLAQLESAGISLSLASEAREAVRGATLVVMNGPLARDLTVGKLAVGAIVVSGLGQEPPGEVVTQADQLYVDDAGLLSDHPRSYLTASAGCWSRRRLPRRVEADLVQLMIGTHPGRVHPDHVLLVDLLSADSLSPELARRIHLAARRQGLGTER